MLAPESVFSYYWPPTIHPWQETSLAISLRHCLFYLDI